MRSPLDAVRRGPARMASSGIDPNTQFTPVTAAVLTAPQAVRGTDGALHVFPTDSTPYAFDAFTLVGKERDASGATASGSGPTARSPSPRSRR
jgi:hypothetical protein